MANLTTIRYRNGSSWINLLNFVYPVGSIYISDRAVSPASLFGGTWAQITGDRYLRASTNFNTGGNNNHQHSMPLGVDDNRSMYIDADLNGHSSLITKKAIYHGLTGETYVGTDIGRFHNTYSEEITPVFQNVFVYRRTA